MENENLTPGQKSSFTRLKNQVKEEANQLLSELRVQEKEIGELRTYLLEDDEAGNCVKTHIEGILEEFETGLERSETLMEGIRDAHNKIHQDTNGFLPEIESAKLEVEEILEETTEYRKKFRESFKVLYGNGESDQGLEKSLLELFEKYEEDLNVHQTKSEELILQIEGALSGATNVELAKAFQDQKKSYSLPKNIWTAVFVISISIMVYLAHELNSLSSEKFDYILEVLKRAPLFGPLIWLSLFASKQQSQNRRLQEEYAHKETIAKTYIGHKRQIDKLKESSEKNELITKLAASTIEAIEFNPGTTLDKHSHKEDMPATELLKLLKSSIDKIGK